MFWLMLGGAAVGGFLWWEVNIAGPVRRYYTAAPGMAPSVPGHGGSTEVSVIPGALGEIDLGTDPSQTSNFLDLYVKGTFGDVTSDNAAVMPGRKGYLTEFDAVGGGWLRMQYPLTAGTAQLTIPWTDNQNRAQISTLTVKAS